MAQTSADTTNLFRPNQVAEARQELKNIEATLDPLNPGRGRISDPRAMRQRGNRLKADLEKYEPKPFRAEEKDAAVQEFDALAAEIKAGMPSSEVMRRNPPGAVNSHLSWEQRNKGKINRWKNLGLRLAAGGDVRSDLAQSADVINIEILRERATSRDPSMDHAQITKTTDFHFGSDPVGTVLFTEEETALLAEIAPGISKSLAILDNDARAEIKDMLKRATAKPDAPEAAAPAQPAEKPEMQNLTFSDMQKLAKQNGMSVFGASKSGIISWLRARHLIR